MIQLTDTLALTADEHNYIVGKPRGNVSKGSLLSSPSYFTNITQAVLYAVSQAMRERVAKNQVTTLEQFAEEQSRLQADFMRKIERLNERNAGE